MKYAHIGVEDQARALQNIPTVGLTHQKSSSGESLPGSKHESSDSWEYPGSKPGDVNGQNVSSIGNTQSGQSTTKPLPETGVIAKNRRLSSVVKSGGGGNRTRGSNLPSSLADNDLRKQSSELGVSWEYDQDGYCQNPAPDVIEFQESLQLIIARWPHLPDHLRQAILAIVRGGGG